VAEPAAEPSTESVGPSNTATEHYRSKAHRRLLAHDAALDANEQADAALAEERRAKKRAERNKPPALDVQEAAEEAAEEAVAVAAAVAAGTKVKVGGAAITVNRITGTKDG
jgi:hypothetical protein